MLHRILAESESIMVSGGGGCPTTSPTNTGVLVEQVAINVKVVVVIRLLRSIRNRSSPGHQIGGMCFRLEPV